MTNTLEDKIAHLLRRAGFGGSREQVSYYTQKGLAATVDELVNYQSIDNPVDDIKLTAAEEGELRIQDVRDWWLSRMLFTDRPLEEKMTLFWHNHFATGASKVRYAPYMAQQNSFLRKNALGNFRDIVKGIARDPAMVIWLDNFRNRKGQPNENFARELMELFTLGIGNYSEKDIKEAARAFTGWFANPRGGGFKFLPRAHDYGPKTFFGKHGNFDGDDIIEIILQQDQCAYFVAQKLVRFFITDSPSPAMVKPYAQLLKDNNYEIKPVVDRMLRSELFYRPEYRYNKVKSPVEFAVGSVRMVARPIPQEQRPLVTRVMSYFLRQMGQELLNPPSVKGWDGGMAWISTNAMLARANMAGVLVGAKANEQRGRIGSEILADFDYLLEGESFPTAEALLERMSLSLGRLEMTPGTSKTLISYIGRSVLDQTKQRVALQMLMSSPEFQLA